VLARSDGRAPGYSALKINQKSPMRDSRPDEGIVDQVALLASTGAVNVTGRLRRNDNAGHNHIAAQLRAVLDVTSTEISAGNSRLRKTEAVGGREFVPERRDRPSPDHRIGSPRMRRISRCDRVWRQQRRETETLVRDMRDRPEQKPQGKG
jgi:hypothetical protein